MFGAEIQTAFALCAAVAEKARESRATGRFPLVLSGNCNVAVGTVAGCGCGSTDVVWFDAHGEATTPETTTSGFLDGMGISILTGKMLADARTVDSRVRGYTGRAGGAVGGARSRGGGGGTAGAGGCAARVRRNVGCLRALRSGCARSVGGGLEPMGAAGWFERASGLRYRRGNSMSAPRVLRLTIRRPTGAAGPFAPCLRLSRRFSARERADSGARAAQVGEIHLRVFARKKDAIGAGLEGGRHRVARCPPACSCCASPRWECRCRSRARARLRSVRPFGARFASR